MTEVLLDATSVQIRLPDGSSVALSIGIASGPLGDGLIGSPGNMQYQCVACSHLYIHRVHSSHALIFQAVTLIDVILCM